jgi:hypothetical protein
MSFSRKTCTNSLPSFRFPNPGSPRRQIWIAALLELNPDWFNFKQWKETGKSLQLCSMHFKLSDYKHQLGTISTRLRAMLNPDAVPSVLGPVVYKSNITHYHRIGSQYSCSCAVSVALFVTNLQTKIIFCCRESKKA